MTHGVSEPLLCRLSEFVADRIGLHFPRERWGDLERGIYAAARELCRPEKDAESCLRGLASSELTKAQVEVLASHLTVGETYFFREKKSFEALENHILPELIRSRRGRDQRLRIWSAGCATGEEPYSLAILLTRVIPDLRDWNITILATDINVRFLQKASAGVYGAWSFRENPQWVQAGYFGGNKEGRFEILPHLKTLVSFSYLNLAEDSYPSLFNNTNAMDIILCRNVLMYFVPERAKDVIRKLACSLAEGGWLLVSPTETSQVSHSQFATVNFPGVALYRKDAKPPETAFAPSWSPPDEPAAGFPPPLERVRENEVGVRLLQDRSETAAMVEEASEPESAPAVYSEAAALYAQGHYAEAAEKILLSFPRNQEEAKAMALLARVCANQGKLAEARAWCEKAIAADKMNPALYFLRSTILQELGSTKEATAALQRCLYLEPDFVLAHFSLGNLAWRQARFQESRRHFQNALSLLSSYRQQEALPESEGITAGRLAEIIRATALGATFT